MKITKHGSAAWSGGLKDGKGTVSTESGALTNQPYGFNTRFDDIAGTNPEELLGAAHAACFTMALSKILGELDLTATTLESKSQVTLEKVGEEFEINTIHLSVTGHVPGVSAEKFRELASAASVGCPVSKLFKGAQIFLETHHHSS